MTKRKKRILILLGLIVFFGGCTYQEPPRTVLNTAPQNPICLFYCYTEARIADVEGDLSGIEFTKGDDVRGTDASVGVAQ